MAFPAAPKRDWSLSFKKLIHRSWMSLGKPIKSLLRALSFDMATVVKFTGHCSQPDLERWGPASLNESAIEICTEGLWKQLVAFPFSASVSSRFSGSAFTPG